MRYSLVDAILNGGEKEIEALLQSAPINESSLQGTPLIAAANVGRQALVQVLLQRGADPNATTEIGKQTALYQAAGNGHVEVVEILSSTTRKDIYAVLGWTPLHAAASSGHAKIVEHLLDAGFDRDAQDEEEMTALAYSVQQGHVDVVRLLLRKGAKDLPNKRKEHVLDHAVVSCEGKDNEAILNLLRGAHFTKMNLTSRVSKAFNRQNCWKLDTFGLWALRRALK
ncbi:ankyrin [Penicillium atrosanguineum]|nr:ankyrin [Penicillium atrosanguineum]